MKTETVYTTLDGTRHNSLDDAKRHADAQYANELANICHRLLRETNGQYKGLPEFINDNLPNFQRLSELKKDAETWENGEGDRYVWREGENGRRGKWEHKV